MGNKNIEDYLQDVHIGDYVRIEYSPRLNFSNRECVVEGYVYLLNGNRAELVHKDPLRKLTLWGKMIEPIVNSAITIPHADMMGYEILPKPNE